MTKKQTPLQRMFRSFVVLIVLIIAAVSVFNFVIFKGKLPAGMISSSLRDIGEACDEDSLCYEPLQCVSYRCVLLVLEKGSMCNSHDLLCAAPFVCHQNICKQRVGKDQACDVRSMSMCANPFMCLDGVCRALDHWYAQ